MGLSKIEGARDGGLEPPGPPPTAATAKEDAELPALDSCAQAAVGSNNVWLDDVEEQPGVGVDVDVELVVVILWLLLLCWL